MQPMVTMTKEKLYSEFSSRLNEACDDLGWPKTGRGNRVLLLIEKLPFEVSRNGARKWFYAEGMPDSAKMGFIAKALNVSMEWLTTGTGPKNQSMVRDQAANYPVETTGVKTTPDNSDIPVPQYRNISLAAGAGSSVQEHEEPESQMFFKKKWMNYKGLDNSRCAVVYARGDSMAPVIQDGSVILVNMADKTIVDGKYYALNYNGEARVKTLYKQIDGSILIKSINPDPAYQDEVLKPDELDHLHIIGRVVWVGNEL